MDESKKKLYICIVNYYYEQFLINKNNEKDIIRLNDHRSDGCRVCRLFSLWK